MEIDDLTEAEVEALRAVAYCARKPRGGDTMSSDRRDAFDVLEWRRLVRTKFHQWGPYELTPTGRALVERLEGYR